MITFGGSDLRNFTPKVIKILNKKYPQFTKKIIIGTGFTNINSIENIIDSTCELVFFPSEKQMKKIMMESDIAITAGGQTVYELITVSVPAISIAVAENQLESVKKIAQLGLNYYAGWWEEKEILKNIISFIEELKDIQIRKKMIELGKEMIKPDGSRRIVNYLINYLIKYLYNKNHNEIQNN